MLASLIDKGLDWMVVPGYSRLGYAARARSWGDADPAARLAGSSVLVTGASSGIGAAACERFAAAGAPRAHARPRPRRAARTPARGSPSRPARTALELQVCDVSSLASVREFAAGFSDENPELHALVNNAGVMPPERTHTDEGFELTFATNVLGPFLLTALLLPTLRRGAPSRVVNVSSGGMYTQRLHADDLQLEHRDYDPPAFYAHTKRCEVVLTELWAERLRGSGDQRPRDAPGLGRHPGSPELAAALSQADAAAAARRRPGRRHDRLARRRARAGRAARACSGTTASRARRTACRGPASRTPTAAASGTSARGSRAGARSPRKLHGRGRRRPLNAQGRRRGAAPRKRRRSGARRCAR